MEAYYTEFFRQEYRDVPTGLAKPFDGKQDWTDGESLQGVYIQDTSTPMLVAQAQGHSAKGRFAAAPDVALKDGDILRRDNDDTYIRLIGTPKKSPEQAVSQVQVFTAEITERPG